MAPQTKGETSGRSAWSWILSALLAAGLFYLAVRGVEWRRVWNAIAGVRWPLIVCSSLLGSFSYFLRALAERMVDAVALVLWGSIVLLGVNPKPAWLESVSWTTTAIAAIGVFAIVVVPHTGGLCEAILARLPIPVALRERLLRIAHQIL